MNQNALYYLKRGLLIALVVTVLSYSLFQTRNIIFGPSIELTSPIDGETYTNPLLEVKGVAENVKSLELDDRPIFTDTKGNFSEKLLLSPGYNILKLEATDKFGKKLDKIIQVILKENQKVTPEYSTPTATSTSPKAESLETSTSTNNH
jgi:Glucodextranase, domain B